MHFLPVRTDTRHSRGQKKKMGAKKMKRSTLLKWEMSHLIAGLVAYGFLYRVLCSPRVNLRRDVWRHCRTRSLLVFWTISRRGWSARWPIGNAQQWPGFEIACCDWCRRDPPPDLRCGHVLLDLLPRNRMSLLRRNRIRTKIRTFFSPSAAV